MKAKAWLLAILLGVAGYLLARVGWGWLALGAAAYLVGHFTGMQRGIWVATTIWHERAEQEAHENAAFAEMVDLVVARREAKQAQRQENIDKVKGWLERVGGGRGKVYEETKAELQRLRDSGLQ